MKNLIVSKLFKFKCVSKYKEEKLLYNISLSQFSKSIKGIDGDIEIKEGDIVKSTFSNWIKQVQNFDLEVLFNLSSDFSEINWKSKKESNKILKKKIIRDIKEYKNSNNSNNDYNNNKNKRNNYGLFFKKKWVDLFKIINSKRKKTVSIKRFCSVIHGTNDNGNLVNKGTIHINTFRGWIKLIEKVYERMLNKI